MNPERLFLHLPAQEDPQFLELLRTSLGWRGKLRTQPVEELQA